MASSSLWQRFQEYFLRYADLDFSIDISRMKFPADFFEKMRPGIENAFAAMRELESGAIANPGEKRMVGHYWLRNPALAPTPELRANIEETNKRISKFAADVHAGKIADESGRPFHHILLTGIGGSALGPELVADALGSAHDPMDIYLFDNTDPDGFDIDEFLAGAAAMDERTRIPDAAQNAAMLLALMWYYAGNGKGEKDMVILPYKDRLALFSKYLQQLVMESLGKEKDLNGNIVHQGIAVYGNKGSTDQHAYVQ